MTDIMTLQSPFMVYSGVVIESMQGGESEVSVELAPELLNSGGMAHGGLIATLVDSAAGAAAFSIVAKDKMALTTDFNMTCLKSSGQGQLTATGKVIHRGRRLMHADVEVYSQQELIARGAVSFMLIDRPVPTPA